MDSSLNQDKTEHIVVSICCVTYNHENFIGQCLDGFVMQQTNFKYEILVHEDASTDQTATIIKQYQKRYPHLFRCVFQTENQFYKQNTLTNILFPMARGKYIALCEGDDYWTDPLKLQKQVDFLEANPDFAICFHKVSILENESFKDDSMTRGISPITTISDLAKGNYIHTLSCVFKNNILKNTIGSHFTACPLGDYYLHMVNAQFGKIYKIDETMGVYRIHNNSMWSSKSDFYKNYQTLKSLRCVLLDLPDTHQDVRLILKSNYVKSIIHMYKNFSKEPSFNELIPDSFENYSIKLLVEHIAMQSYGAIVFRILISMLNIFKSLIPFPLKK